MKIEEQNNMVQLPVWCILLLIGINANALPYDYTASIECLTSPHEPQYHGGIVTNPELNDGLKGWSTFGNAKIEHRELGGNKFIVAHTRANPYDSVSQNLYLRKNRLYTFSAWIQVSEGSVPVIGVFKTKKGFKHAGAVAAQSNCWSMLKGGLTVGTSGPAQLYFESKNTSVEIWVDSISLQPFTVEQWKSHQDQSIEKTRKAKVKIQAADKQGNPLSNAKISIEQKKAGFPFGCAINKNILSNPAYQNWFTSRFKFTVFEDEMKWYSTEQTYGNVDYSIPDAMIQFAKQNNISVRGHNVFWDDPKYQPGWLNSLSPSDFKRASMRRLKSIMLRYKGKVIAWDVVNENMHFSFFESKLGQNASAVLYKMAQKVDGNATLFLNEFNTIEDSRDDASSRTKYLKTLKEIKGYPGNENLKLGIGLESHFNTPNLPYMRASIDILAAANLPIWLTEVDVESSPNQAQYLEEVLREAHGHPKVTGIILWSAWKPEGCYRMCLTDHNFKNLPTGDVVDKLMGEWFGIESSSGMADANGFFEISLSHGEYLVKIHHQASNSSFDQMIVLASSDDKKLPCDNASSSFNM